MNVLDAKVIDTVRGLEMYVDALEHIQIKELHIPTKNHPFYEIQFGIEYFLLRDSRYYDSQINYFGICMSEDFSVITLKETETQSLFAVKSEDEREATKNLLGEWFIKTSHYQEVIHERIENVKAEDVYTEQEIRHNIEVITFLERLLAVTTEDIQAAIVEKPVQLQVS